MSLLEEAMPFIENGSFCGIRISTRPDAIDEEILTLLKEKYKEAVIKLEVIDVNNGMKHVDSNAKIRQKVGQTYVEFETEILTEFHFIQKILML